MCIASMFFSSHDQDSDGFTKQDLDLSFDHMLAIRLLAQGLCGCTTHRLRKELDEMPKMNVSSIGVVDVLQAMKVAVQQSEFHKLES